VDPLRCAVCQNHMRAIAVIDDPRAVEKILRHLGAWHDPPPRPPPQAVPGPYTYEPCDDVDPTPDYENVLTDLATISPSPPGDGGACLAATSSSQFRRHFGPGRRGTTARTVPRPVRKTQKRKSHPLTRPTTLW